MDIVKRIIVVIIISLVCIGCDQGTKLLATEYLPKNEMLSYFYDTVRIGYTENIGAFLGLGNTLSIDQRFWVFFVAVGLILAALFFYIIMSKKQNIENIVGLSLVFSGGVSNYYDRVSNNGAVVDYLNIGIGSLRTGIFNVADMMILLGVAVILHVHVRHKLAI